MSAKFGFIAASNFGKLTPDCQLVQTNGYLYLNRHWSFSRVSKSYLLYTNNPFKIVSLNDLQRCITRYDWPQYQLSKL